MFGSSSSSSGGLREEIKRAEKARKVLELQRLAPVEYRDHFITVTQYKVPTKSGKNETRYIFQERTWNGSDGFTSKIISAHTAQEAENRYPGIVVVKAGKGYSRSLGPGKGRTSDIKNIEAYSRGRISAPRASVIPTGEFKAVAKQHGIPPRTVTAIIRDMDAFAYDELKEAEEGDFEPYYKGDVHPYYAKGSAKALARSAKGKAYTASRKASHGSTKAHTASSRTAAFDLFSGATGRGGFIV